MGKEFCEGEGDTGGQAERCRRQFLVKNILSVIVLIKLCLKEKFSKGQFENFRTRLSLSTSSSFYRRVDSKFK